MSEKQMSKLTNRERRRGAARAVGISTFMIAGLVASVLPASPAAGDGGEYKYDFTAAAPASYDNEIGGGAFNDRTVGTDIVESLEGGDFKCLDIVTFLTQIRRDSTNPGPAETLELNFSFLADTTGQSGVAMVPPPLPANAPTINSGAVSNGTGNGSTDDGFFDFNGASVISFDFEEEGVPFTKGAETLLTLRIDDVDPGEWVVLRVDLLLACDTPRPTGNLQAKLNSVNVVDGVGVGLDPVPGGAQTVPFKQVGAIYPVACPEQDVPCNSTSAAVSANFVTGEAVTGETVTEPSGNNGSKSKRTPVIGTVTEVVGTNPEASTMFVAAGLIGLIAIRRRSTPRRRPAS
jgi:hypothetical protein